MPVECSAHPCPQEALRDCISTLKSSGQLELTTSSLNTNSGIREILLPGSGPLTAHRHCSSGPGHCPALSLWKGDHTRGLVTWDVPARISDKSLPWFGSRKTLSLQASCSLLPSRRAVLCCRAPKGRGERVPVSHLGQRLCATSLPRGSEGWRLGAR